MLLIGARIAQYRKQANMNQEEFASQIGVSRQAVSKWETDKAYPDLDKLVDIAQVFHISIDELINGKDVSESDETESEQQTEPGKSEEKTDFIDNGNDGRHKSPRLLVCAILVFLLFLFCATVFCTVLFRHSWEQNEDFVQNARVERVYRQYTKADISFFAADSRKVQKTVWLDMDGIRDGDYIECYTDDAQEKINIEYFMSTLIVPGAFTVGFLIIFVLLLLEMHVIKRGKNRRTIAEKEHQDESEGIDE